MSDLGSGVFRVSLQSEDEADASLDLRVLEELEAAIDLVASTPRSRALLLEGSPTRFCLGMKLEAIAGVSSRDAIKKGVDSYANSIIRIKELEAITLSAVDGAAIGGGLGLVAAADIAIATARASFGLPEVMVGLIPAMVLPIMADRIPVQKARRLALGHPSLTAEEALRWGIVDRVVERPELLGKIVAGELRNLLRSCPRATVMIKDRTISRSRSETAAEIRGAAAALMTLLEDRRVLSNIERFAAGEPQEHFARLAAPKLGEDRS